MKNYAQKTNGSKKNSTKKRASKVASTSKNDVDIPVSSNSITEEDIIEEIETGSKARVSEVEDPLLDMEPMVSDYAKPQVVGDIDSAPEIPEEVIERPIVDLNESSHVEFEDNPESSQEHQERVESDNPSRKTETFSGTFDEEPSAKVEMGNPDFEGRTRKEKNEAAEYLAETCVDGYQMAHNIVLSFLLKNDEKLMKQALKGKIELDAIDSEIQIGNKVYQVKKLLYDYNTSLEAIMQVSPEFREQVVPLLQQEFARKDIGMTPMQRIVALVMKDLQPKFVQISQLVTTMNDVLKKQSEIIKQNKESIDVQQADPVDDPIVVDHIHQEPEEKEQQSN